jgi:MYXO-CTERM domain-containing protein
MKKIVGILAVAGMAWSAHAQIGIVPSNVPFVDISVTGTSIGSISDDSETTVAGASHGWAGNGLLAGGMSFRVGNNGGIIWGNSATDTFTGATDVGYYNAGPNHAGSTSIATMGPLNTSDSGNGGGVRQFLAVLWDDNFPSTSSVPPTNIRWQVIGNDLIVQWTNEDHFAAQGAGFITYEMIAHGGVSIGSGASLVDFVYQDTLYQASQYQNDGGSAAIGYKNWGLNGGANDVEYGIGGGGTGSTSDPAFGDASMQPKVGGWVASANAALPHSVSIVPAPGALALLGLGGLAAGRRRR